MFLVCTIYPIYIQYIQYVQYIQYIQYICYEKRTPGTPSHEMERSTHLSVWLMCKGNEIKIFLATPLPPSGKKSYRILEKNGLLEDSTQDWGWNLEYPILVALNDECLNHVDEDLDSVETKILVKLTLH